MRWLLSGTGPQKFFWDAAITQHQWMSGVLVAYLQKWFVAHFLYSSGMDPRQIPPFYKNRSEFHK